MSGCCEREAKFGDVSSDNKKRRRIVIALNAIMFAVKMGAGHLARYKDGDANVRSVWLCSRNEAIGNITVMLAALGVWGTATGWPELIVATVMAGLFLSSSSRIIGQPFLVRRETTLRRNGTI